MQLVKLKAMGYYICGGSRIMGKKVGKNLIKAVFNGNLWKNCGLFGYVINKKALKKCVKTNNTY